MIVGIAALALLGGCGKPRDRGKANEWPQDAATQAAASTSAAPAVPKTITARAGYAVFKKERLDECTDLSVQSPFELGQEKPMAVVAEMRSKFMPKDAVHVSSCSGQFADRVVLGSCLIEETVSGDGGVAVVRIASSYYSVVTTKDSDAHMRACLKDGGKWSAPSKDDPEAARERLRQRASALQDIANQAQ
ncbi:MAG TPA: hypothetical protein VM493_07765 [Vicinamibacterales bacterium]|nr:hypothetical protein [Vicinamibacterales bacterium]